MNLRNKLFFLNFVFVLLPLFSFSQTDSLNKTAGSPPSLLKELPHAKPSVSDTVKKKGSCKFRPFIRFASGIGMENSTYTSELITATSPGITLSKDYTGRGYAVPLDLVIGFRVHDFKIGLGASEILFQVKELTRKGDTLEDAGITGNAVKHQIKSPGKNYLFPVFIEYTALKRAHFDLDVNLSYGMFFHDIGAYDGTYAPSATNNISGFAFSFGLSPTYRFGHFSAFLNPALRISDVSYNGATKDELTDVYLTLGLGCSWSF